YQVTQPRVPGGEANEVWIRGRGLGGSSSINGMIWSRGEPADYDSWEALGCEGWNGKSMTKIFQGIEDHSLGKSPMRGVGGPVPITAGHFKYPLAERMIDAGVEMGLQKTDDLNDVTDNRIGYYSHNIHKGKRQSGAVTFLKPALSRPNLHIMTHTTAKSVIFADKQAVGVHLCKNNTTDIEVRCSGEIILAAGTMESPQILERSGIGDSDRLTAIGITPIAHSPDVGNCLHEHLSYAIPFRLKEQDGINRSFFGLGLVKSVLQYYLTHTGAMSTGPFEIGAFVNVAHPDKRPDLQLYLGGYTFALSDDNHPVPLNNIDKKPGISIYGQLLRLTSKGTVHIQSSDPSSGAEIMPNWLSTKEDQNSAIAAIRYMRKFMTKSPLAEKIDHELLPGSHLQSDEELLESFRGLSTCGLHGTGTCRMGGDENSVVDSKLRVRGVRGLRVADCSVIPSPVTGNTNAPAMAVGWRAADIILAARAKHE
ncbi:MAG: GMC family oxidoreductase N-terminal domain-containing protein, partial [Emcibacter sp.]|nr:GMC family oxidoreductase N-terminal domain-containing protein [Emcibacter sp.]